eukprot:scaffold56553_cov11-Prasinocladus_malaysianus.AAC.1
MSLAKAARSDNATVPEGQHASASKCPLANGNVSPAVGSFLQRIVAFKDPESGKPLSDPARSRRRFSPRAVCVCEET